MGEARHCCLSLTRSQANRRNKVSFDAPAGAEMALAQNGADERQAAQAGFTANATPLGRLPSIVGPA